MTAVSLSPAFSSILRYESLKVMRQRAFWSVLVPLAMLSLVVAWAPPSDIDDPLRHISGATLVTGILCTSGIGVVLADRYVRGLGHGMSNLIAATPHSVWIRLLAVLAGSLRVALAFPLLVVVVSALPAALAGGGMPSAVAAVAAFTTMLVPGAVALTALACFLGLVFPITLARIATAGIWLWSTIASPQLLPVVTPTGTLLSPVGGYPAAAWFGERSLWASRELTGPLSPPPDTGTALVNLGILAIFTALMLALSTLVVMRRG